MILAMATAAVLVTCEAQNNYHSVWSREVSISEGEKLEIGSFDEFKVFLRAEAGTAYQIEIFDSETPARHYAGGHIVVGKDSPLKWTLWTRDRLVEVACRRR